MSTILNPKQRCYSIHHEVINFSSAQHRFSFSKDTRFPNSKPTTPTDFTTTLPTTFGRKSPTFGVGERFKIRIPKNERKFSTVNSSPNSSI